MENYRKRADRLRQLMGREGIDGMVLMEPEHIYYLAGFWGYGTSRRVVAVIPQEGSCALISPCIEAAYARSSTWMEEVVEYSEWPQEGLSEDVVETLSEVLREKGLEDKVVGLEESFVPVALQRRLAERLPRARWVNGRGLLEEMRLIKGPEEIEIMRQTGRVAAAEMKAAAEAIQEGVYEYEINIAVIAAGTRAAARFLGPSECLISPVINGVQVLVSGGERADWVHGRASTHRLRRGDLVALCFCDTAHFRGYHLGFDRPVIVGGEATVEQRRLLDAALEAHDAALASIRPGVEARDLDRQANRILEARGYLAYRLHRTGRGVGVGYAEKPELRSSDRTALAPGMTFTVEPGIYVPGLGAARFGETVAVTETGYEMLTDYPAGWQGR